MEYNKKDLLIKKSIESGSYEAGHIEIENFKEAILQLWIFGPKSPK